MTKAKYRQGDGFTNIYELIAWIEGGNNTYWNTATSARPINASVMQAQQLNTLKRLVKTARRAVLVEVPA